ncbi:hypothetical protein SAMN04488026_108810 [Aliiruegeria lutimaris]|uniref:Uncharacterized protein n=1 Tax=Aliiruegeria lutimaris TaxID=571298 RepID=A0A1G9KEY1_9RHOB|nr:hypothetical protein SAMN04488026_108810 [Aliiruegeria lutimaris]
MTKNDHLKFANTDRYISRLANMMQVRMPFSHC